jgi:membrane protein YqaA with SNARE-associated domain
MHHFVQIILNYLFIQFSIIAFVAPFYLVYKYFNPEVKFRHLALNKHIEDFFSSPQANYLVFFWAAAEAICWFIIPEFLLLLVIFLRVRNKITLLIYDISGTAFGTVLGLFLSFHTHFDVSKVLYISQNMVFQVQAWYKELGSFGLFFQPFSGVPYKVFVLSAHSFNLNWFWFVILAILIRVARYYIFYLIFVGLYPFLHRLISKNYIPIFLLSCFLFSAIFLRVYHAYGQDYIINTRGAEGVNQVVHFFTNKIFK